MLPLALPAVEPTALYQRVVMGARYALWRPDGRGDDPPCPTCRASWCRCGSARIYRGCACDATPDRRSPRPLKALPEKAAVQSRVRPLYHQLQAEILAFLGEYEGALAFLQGSVDAGLHHRLWMQRCPAIAPLRADATWPNWRRG